MLLVLEGHLDSLAFLIKVNVRDIASVEGQVLLTHCVRVKRLIHSVILDTSLGHGRSTLGRRLWLQILTLKCSIARTRKAILACLY